MCPLRLTIPSDYIYQLTYLSLPFKVRSRQHLLRHSSVSSQQSVSYPSSAALLSSIDASMTSVLYSPHRDTIEHVRQHVPYLGTLLPNQSYYDSLRLYQLLLYSFATFNPGASLEPCSPSGLTGGVHSREFTLKIQHILWIYLLSWGYRHRYRRRRQRLP